MVIIDSNCTLKVSVEVTINISIITTYNWQFSHMMLKSHQIKT